MGMRWIGLDLLTQITDVKSHVMIFFAILPTPDAHEERLVSEDPTWVRDEVIEQSVLGRRELDLCPISIDFAPSKIDDQVLVDLDLGLGQRSRHFGSAHDRLDTAEQLPLAKWLRNVVVGAEAKAADLVALFPLRS